MVSYSIWPYLAPFPRYADLLVKNTPFSHPPLVFGDPVKSEAVGVKQRPSVTKN